MTLLTRFKFFLWYFGRFKVPMIGYVHPKIITLDDHRIIIKLPLCRRNRNHLHSMYFGALSVGADIAGGMHGFYHADQMKHTVSLAFKSFQAQFLKRPESDVYFISEMGQDIKAMIETSKKTGERMNKPIRIKAFIHYDTNPEEVADFTLELSIKVI